MRLLRKMIICVPKNRLDYLNQICVSPGSVYYHLVWKFKIFFESKALRGMFKYVHVKVISEITPNFLKEIIDFI